MTQDPFGIHTRDQLDAAEREAITMSHRAMELFNDGIAPEAVYVKGFASPILTKFKAALDARRIQTCRHLTSPQPVFANLCWTAMYDDGRVIAVCARCAYEVSQRYNAIYADTEEEFTCDLCRVVQSTGLNILNLVVGVTTVFAGLCDSCNTNEVQEVDQ